MPRQARLDAPRVLRQVMGQGIEGTKIFHAGIRVQRGGRYLGATTSMTRLANSEELSELSRKK